MPSLPIHIRWQTIAAVGLCLASFTGAAAQPFTISGYVEDESTGERISGANLYLPATNTGAASNEFGFYSLTVPRDTLTMWVTHVGFDPLRYVLSLGRDTVLTVRMTARVSSLDELEVTAAGESAVDIVQMSRHVLPVEQIEMLPVILGEVDIQKTLQLLPGVQAGLEGASGLYVRGGRADQNLILVDGIPLYNPSHVFGFFSVFNSYAIKQVELIKGGFPARYGGRLSSVIAFTMKEGNMKEFAGEASVGLLASRAVIEGPLIRDKASFMIAGRRTYVDLLMRPFQPRHKRVSGFFDDVNAKANLIVSPRDRLHLSLFSGRDGIQVYRNHAPRHSGRINEFRLDLGWTNQMASLRWNRLISNQVFASMAAAVVAYRYSNKYRFEDGKRDEGVVQATHDWTNRITDWMSRIDVEYARSVRHNWNFGVQLIQHRFLPGRTQAIIKDPDAPPVNLVHTPKGALDSFEMAAYAEDNLQIGADVKMSAGLRYSAFAAKGVWHQAIAPRLAVSWRPWPRTALKASGMFANQYMHLVTGGGTALPADLWIPVQDGIAPQGGVQAAMGVAHAIGTKGIELSAEVFAKRMRGLLDYKEGSRSYSAAVVGWPDLLEVGRGHAYGLELFAEKRKGSMRGWVGYTWARSMRRFARLNRGRLFPDGFDRRHDLSIAGQFWLTGSTHVSAAWVYGSGYPIWVPAGAFYTTADDYHTVGGLGPFFGVYPYDDMHPFLDWTEVNSGRVSAYHRLDLSVHFKRKTRRGVRTLVFGVYNAYNRRNPMYVFPKFELTSRPAAAGGGTGYRVQFNKVSLLQLIPAVSWQFTF